MRFYFVVAAVGLMFAYQAMAAQSQIQSIVDSKQVHLSPNAPDKPDAASAIKKFSAVQSSRIAPLDGKP